MTRRLLAMIGVLGWLHIPWNVVDVVVIPGLRLRQIAMGVLT